MSRIRIGTASWTDPTLVKESSWYPKRSMSAEQRLRYYASIFPLVEVDATYYFPPTEDLAGLWTRRTSEDFRFAVKAYALLTGHGAKTRSLWPDVAADLRDPDKDTAYLSHLPPEAVDRAFAHFHKALAPLYSAGKLGAVAFQFPPWFTPRRENRDYIASLPDRLPDYPISVEFRNAAWLDDDTRDRTLRLLSSHGISYVCVDEPQGFPSSVPPLDAVTAPLAVLRLHGRNAETWEAKGLTPAERFRYRYDQEELRELAGRARHLAEQADEVHVLFNNCYRDYGVRNARELGALLGTGLQPDAPPDPPED
ncbi:MAG TPA: DUF72 domain-containing protein [Egibacteraceae bacterium]